MERNDIGPLEAYFNGEPASAEQIIDLENHAFFLLDKVAMHDVHYQYTLPNPDGTIITFSTHHSERQGDARRLPADTQANLSLAHGLEDNVLLKMSFDTNNLTRVFWSKPELADLADTTDLLDSRRQYSDEELAALTYIRNLIAESVPGSEEIRRSANHTSHVADLIRKAVTDNTLYGLRVTSYTKRLQDGRQLSIRRQLPFGLIEIADDIATVPVLTIDLVAIDPDDLSLAQYRYERLQSGIYDLDSHPFHDNENPAVVSEEGRLLMSASRLDGFREAIGLKVAGQRDVSRLIHAMFTAATERIQPRTEETDTIDL